jgi:pyruvate dehydrogenase E1 component alpha subunit
MGDGTLGRGEVHESMNLAAVWNLPIIYVLINNHYAISTHYREAHPQDNLSDYAKGHNIPGYTIDGNDIEAVYEAAKEAAERARAGEGPTLLELKTYRWQGHFAGDPAAYRPEEEVKAWKEKCPIKRTNEKLVSVGITEEEIKAIEQRAFDKVDEMVEYSIESPDPKPEDAITHVYVDREVQGR